MGAQAGAAVDGLWLPVADGRPGYKNSKGWQLSLISCGLRLQLRWVNRADTSEDKGGF